MSQDAISPFDAESIQYMLWGDAQSEGVLAVPYKSPDARMGAFGVLIGARSPGANISGSNHDRSHASPIITTSYPVRVPPIQMGR